MEFLADIVQRMQGFLTRFEELGCRTLPLTVAPPATEDEVVAVEVTLGYHLPEDLRQFFLTSSSGIEFWWNSYDEHTDILSLPGELAEICSGELRFSLERLAAIDDMRDDLADLYDDPDDPYAEVFLRKLAFMTVGNGDLLAIDLNEDHPGAVVYLTHDGESMHGYVLGESFISFLDAYTQLACPGPEWWVQELFTNEQTTPLDPQGELALRWLRAIGG